MRHPGTRADSRQAGAGHRSAPAHLGRVFSLALALIYLPGLLAPAAAHDCKCRFAGRDWSLGQRACFGADGASRLMECRMNQNITAWVEVADGCPAAAAGSRWTLARGAAPAVRATPVAAFRAQAAVQP